MTRQTRFALLLGLLAAPQAVMAQVTGPHKFQFVSGSGVGFHGYPGRHLPGQARRRRGDEHLVHRLLQLRRERPGLSDVLGRVDLSKTRWGGLPNQPNLYQQAAYLTTLFQAKNHAEWGYIHYAIWQLMNGGSPTSGRHVAAREDGRYKALAAGEYGKYDYSGMYVLTDVRVTKGNMNGQSLQVPGCAGVQGKTSAAFRSSWPAKSG